MPDGSSEDVRVSSGRDLNSASEDMMEIGDGTSYVGRLSCKDVGGFEGEKNRVV